MDVTVHRTETLHQGRVFRLDRERVTLENGTTADLDVIRHPGAAAVVPFVDADTVLLLHQYRHTVGRRIWEIPAGTLEPPESAQACARRELVEETGYRAGRWWSLGPFLPLPGYADERITLFCAGDLSPATQRLDADEVLSVHPIAFRAALDMVAKGEIVDGKTIVGLYLATLCGFPPTLPG
jgi:ADP-ribose pyrophosphatase